MATDQLAPTNSLQPVWFVTGCSSGLGRALASQIVASGQRLIATSRDVSRLSYLSEGPNVLKLDLSITSGPSVTAALRSAIEKFGRIDVLINNAGYGLFGDTEAVSIDEARAQFETNFWGPVKLSREAVEIMREVNSRTDLSSRGVIVQVSSFGGWIGFPRGAFYYASKAALELFTESLSREVHPNWGIKFLILEPGGITTEFAGSNVKLSQPHPQYQSEDMPGNKITTLLADDNLKTSAWSSPDAIAKAAVSLVEQIRKGEKNVPLRLPLGRDATELVLRDAKNFCREIEAWKEDLDVEQQDKKSESKELQEWMSTLGEFVNRNE